MVISGRVGSGGDIMATWLIIVIIVLAVLFALFLIRHI